MASAKRQFPDWNSDTHALSERAEFIDLLVFGLIVKPLGSKIAVLYQLAKFSLLIMGISYEAQARLAMSMISTQCKYMSIILGIIDTFQIIWSSRF